MNTMNAFQKSILALALSGSSFATLASNSGTDLNLSAHTIAGSMGGAAYTKPQEPSAGVFGNPATMTQFKGTHYNFGASFLKISELENIQSTTLSGMGITGEDLTFENSSISSADNYVLPTFGSTFQLSDKAVFGFGLEVDAGLGADFRDDPISLLGGAGNLLVGSKITLPLIVELVSLNANFAGAYQVTPQLSLGASLTVGFGLAQLGTVGYTSGLDALGAPLGGAVSDFGGTTASVHDTAVGASIGAIYSLPSGLAFSATVKSSLEYAFEDILYAKTVNFEGFQTLNIEQPLEVIVGVALDDALAKDILIEVDAIWKNWSNANSYEDIYDDQMLLTLGIQFKDVLPGVDFRIGYSHAENPLLEQPNNTINNLSGAGSLPLGTASDAIGLSAFSTDVIKIVQMSIVPVIWENTFSAGIGYKVTENISINAFASIASGEEDSRNLANVDAILSSLGINSTTVHTVDLDTEVIYGFSVQINLL